MRVSEYLRLGAILMVLTTTSALSQTPPSTSSVPYIAPWARGQFLQNLEGAGYTNVGNYQRTPNSILIKATATDRFNNPVSILIDPGSGRILMQTHK